MYLNKEQILQIGNFFRDKPVNKVFLFGSYATGSADNLSDIDLLIEPQNDFNFLQFQIQIEGLERIMGKKIDAVTSGALRPDRLFTKYVLQQKIAVYERND